MTIRADQVRFRRRDVAFAIAGAAVLGAIFGCVVLLIPTLGSSSSGPTGLLWLFLAIAAVVGALVGLGAAAGAAIAYAIARSWKASRVAVFTVAMAVGGGVGGALGILVFLFLGDNGDHYTFLHPAIWVPGAAALFVAAGIPVAIIVPLAFRARARHPLSDGSLP
jgi:MFS family permease